MYPNLDFGFCNRICAVIVGFLLTFSCLQQASGQAAVLDEVEKSKQVDFSRDILPMLRDNCIACHFANEAEGGLNLEDYEAMVKGGDSGAALTVGQPAASLLLQRARATDEDEAMPPLDNSVGARQLNEKELKLLERWIAQGAKEGGTASSSSMQWQAIPATLRSIYSVDISPDNRWVASSRANRVEIYDRATRKLAGQLVDKSLEPTSSNAADVDVIKSLAFSPDGRLLATGGYRTVRIWKKGLEQLETPAGCNSVRSDMFVDAQGKRVAFANAVGDVVVRDLHSGELLQELKGRTSGAVKLLWPLRKQGLLISCDEAGVIIVWDLANGRVISERVCEAGIAEWTVAPDANYLAVKTFDEEVLCWKIKEDFETVNLPPEMNTSSNGNARVSCIELLGEAEESRLLCSVGSELRSWQLAAGKWGPTYEHGADITSLLLLANGQVVTGGVDGVLKSWDLATGEMRRSVTPVYERFQLARVESAANRQKVKVKRVEEQGKALEAALTKEEAAVKKVVEARDKAGAKVTEQQEKRVQAETNLGELRASFAEKTEQRDDTQKQLAVTEASLSKQVKEAEVLSDELAEAKRKHAELEAMLTQAKQDLTTAEQNAMRKQQEVSASQKTSEELKLKLGTLAKSVDSIEKNISSSEQQFEQLVKAEDSARSELAKREQALIAAQQARDVAAQAVPKHQTLVSLARTKNRTLARRLADAGRRYQEGRGVTRLAANRSATRLVSVSQSGLVVLWDWEAGNELDVLSNISKGSFQLLPDDTLLISSPDSVTRYATSPTWELDRTLGGPSEDFFRDSITALSFRQDGKALAVGDGEPSRLGNIHVFSIPDGRLLRAFKQVHSDSVQAVRFSPSGERLASAAADKTIRILDVGSERVLRTLEGHAHHVLGVSWSDDERTIASAGSDRLIKVWDVETGGQRRTIGGFGKEVNGLHVLKGKPQVITVCGDGQIRFHDINSGGMQRALNSGDFLFSLAVSPDEKTLVTGGESGSLRFWDVEAGKLVGEVK